VDQREGGAFRRIGNVFRPVFRLFALDAVGDGLHFVSDRIAADQIIVEIEDAQSICRQFLNHLHLLVQNVLLTAEGVQMLRTDGGHDADGRMHEVHQVRDVADMVGAHLADEDFMDRLQHLADRPRDAHRRVVGSRRHQRVVLLGQDRLHDVLRRGLAIAAGDADDLEIRPRGQDALRIIEIMIADGLLNRRRDQRHGIHQNPR